MVLLAKLKELADRVLGEDQRAKHLREEELQLAAAALLVHASVSRHAYSGLNCTLVLLSCSVSGPD